MPKDEAKFPFTLFPDTPAPMIRPDYPVSPYVDVTQNKHGGNRESQKANIKAAPYKRGKREEIYCWFKAHGPSIAEDLLKAFPQWRYSTVTARISELRRDGFLEQCGTRNTEYSHSAAALLRITDKPYPYFQESRK